MKKLILIILLCPLFSLGQQYVSDSTTVKPPLKVTFKSATQKYDDLSLPAATSTTDGYATKDQVNLLVTTSAKANSTEAALAVAVADIKALNDRIARLEALAPGIPEPVIVNSNYTLTANDNGKTIYVYTNATITLPVLAEGFKCKVYRMGNGRPRFVASGITLRLRSGFTPLSVQYAAVNIDYKEGEVVVE
jgi:hypothetical protein